MFGSLLKDRGQRLAAALVLASIVWGLTDVRNRARVDPDDPSAHKSDFTVYTEAGAAFFDGRDPYAVASPRGWHYLYPPMFAILVAPLSHLAPQWQAVCWFFFSVLTAWGCWRECQKIAVFWDSKADRALPAWMGWLAAATVALPVLNCLQRGQVGVQVLYLLLLGFRLMVVTRTRAAVWLGGFSLAAAVTLKLTPLLPTLCLLSMLFGIAIRQQFLHARKSQVSRPRGPLAIDLRYARRAALATALGLLLGFVLIPSLLVGPAANVSHLHMWVSRVVTNQNIGTDNDFNPRGIRNQSLSNAAYRGGNWLAAAIGEGPDDMLLDDISKSRDVKFPLDSAAFTFTMLATKLLLSALLAGAIWAACRASDPRFLAVAFALSCLATLVVSPLSWGHHYTLLLPAALLAPALLDWQRRGWSTRLFAATPLTLVLAHYLLLDWTGRAGLLGMGISAWFAVATVVTIYRANLASKQAEPAVQPQKQSSDRPAQHSLRAA